MNPHTMQDAPDHLSMMWGGAAFLAALLILLVILVIRLTRRARYAGSPLPDLPGSHRFEKISRPGADALTAEDLIFFLPDISNYTRFMTSSRFSFDHAMTIVHALVEAMIEDATRNLVFSKLEGDAALFFVEAGKHSPDVLGESVTGILSAFYRERERLKASNICPCRACRHLDDLDIKIFVHRGKAARFQFNNSVDLFGTDVIVLHRIMKNSIDSHRYVMVTDAAADSIALPNTLQPQAVEENVEHIGLIRGNAFIFGNDLIAGWAQNSRPDRRSVWSGTLSKLRENLRP